MDEGFVGCVAVGMEGAVGQGRAEEEDFFKEAGGHGTEVFVGEGVGCSASGDGFGGLGDCAGAATGESEFVGVDSKGWQVGRMRTCWIERGRSVQ